jgi:CTP synthase (UTP-ammonia lyase)
LSCSVAGTSQPVEILPNTLAHKAYGTDSAAEVYRCRYGLNPAYRHDFFNAEMVVSGIDADGEVRIVELKEHPFFIATLFVPQHRSKPEVPHPLITAYLEAALDSL